MQYMELYNPDRVLQYDIFFGLPHLPLSRQV